jgi:2-oxoglutarate dehydrogenase E2 component (dihydrolipoamide succinyltransferase)
MAESITQGTLASWERQVGDAVHQDDLVANIETDKVTIPVNSPYEGILLEHLAKEGETKGKVGGEASIEAHAKKEKEVSSELDAGSRNKFILAPPIDHESAKEETGLERKQGIQTSDRRERMSRMRLRIAERLKEAQSQAASLTTFNEVDLQALTDVRAKYKDAFLKKHGVKLGFMSPFMMAATRALQDIPIVNASMDMTNQEIIYHASVDISVAVSTPKVQCIQECNDQFNL